MNDPMTTVLQAQASYMGAYKVSLVQHLVNFLEPVLTVVCVALGVYLLWLVCRIIKEVFHIGWR